VYVKAQYPDFLNLQYYTISRGIIRGFPRVLQPQLAAEATTDLKTLGF